MVFVREATSSSQCVCWPRLADYKAPTHQSCLSDYMTSRSDLFPARATVFALSFYLSSSVSISGAGVPETGSI